MAEVDEQDLWFTDDEEVEGEEEAEDASFFKLDLLQEGQSGGQRNPNNQPSQH